MINLMTLMKMNDIQFVGANSEMIFKTLEEAQNSGEIVEVYVWDDNFGWVLCSEF